MEFIVKYSFEQRLISFSENVGDQRIFVNFHYDNMVEIWFNYLILLITKNV